MIKGLIYKFNGRWFYCVIDTSTRAVEYQGSCDAWEEAFRRTYGLVSVIRPWPSHSRTSPY